MEKSKNILKKYGRFDLIKMLLEQSRVKDKLEKENKELKERLAQRIITTEHVGNIADSAIAINDVFNNAQKAAEDYLLSLKDADNKAISERIEVLYRNAQNRCDEMLSSAKEESNAIIVKSNGMIEQANIEANNIIEQANVEARKIVERANIEAGNIKGTAREECDKIYKEFEQNCKNITNSAQIERENILKKTQTECIQMKNNCEEECNQIKDRCMKTCDSEIEKLKENIKRVIYG